MTATAPKLQTDRFDIRVLDAQGAPVLAVTVKSRPGKGQDVVRELRQDALAAGFPYALLVDLEAARLFDLSAAADAPPVFEVPTREVLALYAGGLDVKKVQEQYLVRIMDTWLRNLVQPLSGSPAPGLDGLRAMGLLHRLEGGTSAAEFRSYF